MVDLTDGKPMTPMSEKEFQDYLLQANWFMRARMDENKKEFQLDTFQRFDWSPWRGELIFSNGGVPKVVAKIQIVGSQSTKMSAWTWAWATPGLPAVVRQDLDSLDAPHVAHAFIQRMRIEVFHQHGLAAVQRRLELGIAVELDHELMQLGILVGRDDHC